MNASVSIYAIVPCAGSGLRFSDDPRPKQYHSIHGKTVLEHAVDALLAHPSIKQIVVSLAATDDYFAQLAMSQHHKIHRAQGGARRMDSVFAALNQIKHLVKADDWILVHDAVRPLLDKALLQAFLEQVMQHPVGGILVNPVTDTIKTTQKRSLDRTQLKRAVTPQMFRFASLYQTLRQAQQTGLEVTDEAQAIEQLNLDYAFVETTSNMQKLTFLHDLTLIQSILNEKNKLGVCV